MKRICRIMLALAALLLGCSDPVWALHQGPYLGAYLGGTLLATAKSTDELGSFNLRFDPGKEGSVVLGWDLPSGTDIGEGRVELEYSRRSNPLAKAEFAEGTFRASGELAAESLLINFFGVYRDTSRWTPYAGLGLGAARLTASALEVTGQPLADDSDIVFAYQIGAGVDYALSQDLALDFAYRFLSSVRPHFAEASGGSFEADYRNHALMLGLRAGF